MGCFEGSGKWGCDVTQRQKSGCPQLAAVRKAVEALEVGGETE
jgi:hypothetical protein